LWLQDAASLATAALKTIAAVEGDFHAALDKSYTTMGQTTFKALRRPLPITRQKITWEKIMQYVLLQFLRAILQVLTLFVLYRYKVGDSLGK